MNKTLQKITYPLVTFAILVLLWHLVVHATGVQEALLPGPSVVWDALAEIALGGDLLGHIGASLMRVVVGFVLAASLAIPLGLVIGTRKYLQTMFNPILQALRTISPISWIPLAILWFGIGNAPAIFIIFITAFFPILLSTALAVKHVDPTLIRVGQNFGATPGQLLGKVIMPATTPYIVIGLKVSLGISWVIIVAAEMVGMSSGLGYMILDARNFLRTDIIIAGMLVVGVIGFLLDKAFALFEQKVKKVMGFTLS